LANVASDTSVVSLLSRADAFAARPVTPQATPQDGSFEALLNAPPDPPPAPADSTDHAPTPARQDDSPRSPDATSAAAKGQAGGEAPKDTGGAKTPDRSAGKDANAPTGRAANAAKSGPTPAGNDQAANPPSTIPAATSNKGTTTNAPVANLPANGPGTSDQTVAGSATSDQPPEKPKSTAAKPGDTTAAAITQPAAPAAPTAPTAPTAVAVAVAVAVPPPAAQTTTPVEPGGAPALVALTDVAGPQTATPGASSPPPIGGSPMTKTAAAAATAPAGMVVAPQPGTTPAPAPDKANATKPAAADARPGASPDPTNLPAVDTAGRTTDTGANGTAPAPQIPIAQQPATVADEVHAQPSTDPAVASDNANATPQNVNAVSAMPVLPTPTMWPAAAHPAATARDNTVPVAGLAVEIATRAQDGERHFDIRLDPPELGRIEVHLNVDSAGHVTSHLVADRPDTLDLLRRDAPTLERALQSAGLKTDDGAMQFSLRDQSLAGGYQQTPRDTATVSRLVVPDPELPPVDTAVRGYGRLAGMGSGVDIRV